MNEGGRIITLIVKQVETPEIAVLAKRCGYDALYVDLEYGVIRESAVGPIAQAARKAGITPMVRLPSADPVCATRCLAVGMAGLVVPKVKTMDQVRAMVSALDLRLRVSSTSSRSICRAARWARQQEVRMV